MERTILIVEDEFTVAYQLQTILESAGYTVKGIAVSVPKALSLIEQDTPGLVLLDIHLKGAQSGIYLAEILREKGIPFIYLSANSSQDILEKAKATQPYGFLVKPFREKDLLVTLEIAFYRYKNSREILMEETTLVDQRIKDLSLHDSQEAAFHQLAVILQDVVEFDYMGMLFFKNGNWQITEHNLLRIHYKEYQMLPLGALSTMTGMQISALQQLKLQGIPVNRASFFNKSDFSRLNTDNTFVSFISACFRLRSMLIHPILLEDGMITCLVFSSINNNTYTAEDPLSLARIRGSLESALFKLLAGRQSDAQVVAKQEQGKALEGFENVVGQTSELLHIFDLARKVAVRDTSVLILGENGTGKEKLAMAIHKLSPRAKRAMVVVNCAAIPPDLIESELFGHEKGAFTGAVGQRIGKFEQASGGTIFLDEIGELPLALQVKLLRVLQQREIERVGGKSPVAVDIRIIAATNRNLEKEIAEGRFRMDLYYRLNVFPITLPPLRDRKDDIALLVRYFLTQQKDKNNSAPTDISDYSLSKLMQYDWPGNIRELENIIERAVVLTQGPIIEDILMPASFDPAKMDAKPFKTIQETEKEHIITALKKCGKKIYGPGGAAEMLNIPPSTLSSKIKKLGIIKSILD